MKNSYTVYAAISHDGSSVFQRNHSRDTDSGELLEWFDEWQFDPMIVTECGYIWADILKEDLKREKIDAQIKKYKITVEGLED